MRRKIIPGSTTVGTREKPGVDCARRDVCCARLQLEGVERTRGHPLL